MDNKLLDIKSFKKIYPFLLKKMQSFIHIPDWNQNDPSGDEFIKNKTHYDSRKTIVETKEEIISLTFDGNLEGREYIDEGNGYYTVKISDTPLTKEQALGASCECMTSDGIDNGGGIITEEMINDQGDFLVIADYILSVFIDYVGGMPYTKGTWFGYGTVAGHRNGYVSSFTKTTTITETTVEGELKKLDKKFVPYSTPDWNQNDETAEDFIKNRPFYEEFIESSFDEIYRNSFDFSYCNSVDWGQNKVGYIYEPINLFLEVGKEYTVIFDGNKYTTTCFIESGYDNTVIGNGAFVHDNNPDNGLPFAIGMYNGGNGSETYVIAGDQNKHEIIIEFDEGNKTIIHKIDEKFLPEKYLELVLTDKVTGYDYIVSMVNGKMVYESFCSSNIQIEQYPTKMIYGANETFNPAGMVVIAYCEDGSVKEITNYTYSNVDSDGKVTITYIERGKKYITTIYVDVINELVDFYYTDNGNGTVTITGWKGTLNGEPSTEMVFPNDPRVIL